MKPKPAKRPAIRDSRISNERQPVHQNPPKQGDVRQTLASFRPLVSNPNKHTQQGMGLLDAAMSRHGYVAPMTAAADGTILDGNARLETVATKFPGVDPIIVEHDGTRPIIAIRRDLKNADDPLARDIIVTANRVAEADLAWDVDVLREFSADGLDLAPFEFDAGMLKSLGDVASPDDFKSVDESIETEHACPKCGYRWSGGK
jgi:hypothetical protein